MKPIKITDDYEEQVEIGRQIFAAYPEQYTEQRLTNMKNSLNNNMPNATNNEKEVAFFHSIYDYWVYGNDIWEDFIFSFQNKTHEEKTKYITSRTRLLYCGYLNDKNDKIIFADKYRTYCMFRDEFNREVIQVSGEEDFDLFCSFVEKHHDFFVKPSSLALGKGVYKETISNWSSKRELFEHLLVQGRKYSQISWSMGNKLVLEEVVHQSKEMAALNPTSVNVLRLVTVLVNGEVSIFFTCVRIGRYGNDIAATEEGEIYCGVNSKTGVIDTNGITLLGEVFDEHPDNKIKLKGYQIPRWNEVLALANKIAKRVPSVRYVGWDLALTDDGWIIIEGNENGDFDSQIVYGKPCKEEFEALIGYHLKNTFWWE